MLKYSMTLLLSGLAIGVVGQCFNPNAYAGYDIITPKPPMPKTHLAQRATSETHGPAEKNRLDINFADLASLMQVKGLGRQKAQAIIAYRQQHGPILVLEDLETVKGITPQLIAKMKRLFSAPGLSQKSLA